MTTPFGRPVDPDVKMMDFFVETLGEEDARRPRMELGLGIWTDDHYRYYPMDALRERNFVIDEFAGRPILIYLDPITSTPLALHLAAGSVTFDGTEVVLDQNRRIVSGRVLDAAGVTIDTDRPLQMFTRWYGFALTFPDPEVYE